MTEFIIVIITLLLSALFSGFEIAIISANELQIDLGHKNGHLPSSIVATFKKHTREFIIGMLIGNNISIVIYSMKMSSIMDRVLVNYMSSDMGIMIIETLISTFIILIVAEFIPKSIFKNNSSQMLTNLWLPALVIFYPIYILSNFFNWILSGKKIATVPVTVYDKEDIDNYIESIKARIKEPETIGNEVHIFQNALDFNEVKARECMVPRNKIEAIEVNDSIDKLKERFIETRYSKVLIYKDSIDNIIGYIHSFELFKKPGNIKQILLPITSIVPETMLAKDLLSEFIAQHKSVAVVVDEFGGTAGMVTIEDIIEEIFGEIEDEHDKQEIEEEQINENTFRFSGRIEIDYINEKYNFSLPVSDEYETLAGFILNTHKSIPQAHEQIIINQYVITIIEASNNYIETVEFKINKD